VRYTSTEMQGWRKNMEDSKITELQIKVGSKNYCVFGVFDGHGGTGLAYVQERKCLSTWKRTS